jgi:hypothetical protein
MCTPHAHARHENSHNMSMRRDLHSNDTVVFDIEPKVHYPPVRRQTPWWQSPRVLVVAAVVTLCVLALMFGLSLFGSSSKSALRQFTGASKLPPLTEEQRIAEAKIEPVNNT